MSHKPWSSLVAVVVVVVAGCASPGFQQSETVSLEAQRVREAATAFQASAKAALSTLDALNAEPMLDMASRFRTLSQSVSAADAAKARLERAADGMSRAASARFTAWERDIRSIGDPNTKARAETRRGEVLATYQMAEGETEGGIELATQIVRDLSSLRQLLSNDLTRAGIAANADLTNDVRKNSAQFGEYSHGWFKALDDAITATSITPSVSR